VEQLPTGLTTWAGGSLRETIERFVRDTTTPGSPDFVPELERIAVFDNDGTLWPEQPMYIQLAYALDRVRQLAVHNPSWQTKQPYQAALQGDVESLARQGEPAVLEIMSVTHAGSTTEEFARTAREWLDHARHPTLERLYTDLVYAPMLDLMRFLRAHQYQTFIVSGGGIEFLRVFAERVYGVPPNQIVGSSIRTDYEVKDGRPVLIRKAEIDFIDDGPGKPVGINRFIGRRPIIAVGKSDGDVQMLEYTSAGDGPRLCMLLHHDDSEREFAYDRNTLFGRLKVGLDQASAKG
jgi:phosphoserine phosphatase